MNRIDQGCGVSFPERAYLRPILDLDYSQYRIGSCCPREQVCLQCSDSAKDNAYEGRARLQIRCAASQTSSRAFLVYPLSNLVATGQIGLGDLVHVDVDKQTHKLIFSKSSGGALIQDMPKPIELPEAAESLSGGVGLPIPQTTKVARKSQSRGEKTES